MNNVVKIMCVAAAMQAAAMQAADQAKVAQVMAGELKEARVSWWGFNAEDSTEYLEAAINSKVPKLIVDRQASPWIASRTLHLVSNQEIVFEEGAELLAKKHCFKGPTDALVRLRDIKNVTLRGEGKGATLRMLKSDYHTDEYQKAEWRHCVSILSSQKINILNLNLVESGGDGIYLGISTQNSWPEDIVIRDVVCDGHNRQGISVISGVNVLVENTKLINTGGTAPEAGIDFEPNKGNEPIRNFVMRNCESRNNKGGGYVFYLPNMSPEYGPLDVTLENCVSYGDLRSPFNLTTKNGPGRTMPGQVTVRNCEFVDAQNGVILCGTSSKGFKTLLENVKIRNVASNNAKIAPILVSQSLMDEEAAGNIEFRGVTVEDNLERETFKFLPGAMNGALEAITGKVTTVRNGKTTEQIFTDEWAKKMFKPVEIREIAPYDMTGKTLAPVKPGAGMSGDALADLRQRGTGKYIFWALKGETIRFTVEFGQLAHLQGTLANIDYVTPSGKKGQLAALKFKEVAERVIENAPETGLYTVSVKAGTNWSRLRRSTHPVSVPINPVYDNNLVGGGGNRFFHVPEGTKEFSVLFWGDGLEGLKATVFAPDGRQIWQKDDISRIEQCVVEGELARKGGIFKVLIQPPTNLPVIEDHHMRLAGVPPYISPDAALVMKPIADNP